MTAPLTAEHLHILQHALGLDSYGQPPEDYRGCHDDEFPLCYRNRFVTDPASPDGQACEALITLGLMAKPSRQPSFIGGMTNYFVTQAGYDAVKLHSPRPPRLSRSKQRYRDYLNVADCFADFRSYLLYLTRAKHQTHHA